MIRMNIEPRVVECEKMKKQKSEVRCQRSEARSRRPEVGGSGVMGSDI